MRPHFPSPALLIASALAAASATAQPSFQGLGFMEGYDYSEARAITADGLFVVGYCAVSNPFGHQRAFRWSPHSGMQDLGELPGGADYSQARSVSAHGFHVVGDSSSGNGAEGFRWQGGSMAGIGDLAGGLFFSTANGISADGFVIAGYSNGTDGYLACRSVRGGPLISLGDLPGGQVSSAAYGCSADGAVVAGESSSVDGNRAVRWTAATGMVNLGVLPGGDGGSSSAAAVSADGSVVVGYSDSTDGSQAFRWTAAGGMVGLGDLPGGNFGSEAYACSADGSVVVGYALGTEGEAFIWDAHNGMRSLRDVLIGLGVQGLAGWKLDYGNGISPDGRTIVGFAVNPEGKFEGYIAHLGQPFTQTTERVSISATEQQGNGGSTLGSVSASGQIACFWSNATNLVGGDTNGKTDVFVRNRDAAFTTRVSIASSGTQGNGDSFNGHVSANGLFVVFASDASNLVGSDTNAKRDIFIRDRHNNLTRRLSVTSGGVQSNGDSDLPRVSADGRFVVFQSDASNLVLGDTNGKTDIFLRDRQLNTTKRVSLTDGDLQASGRSFDATVSDDGKSVCFTSDAANLVAGDTNAAPDIFFRNLAINATVRASVSTDGIQGNHGSLAARLSAGGRYIAFTSAASNLYPADTNNADDIFVRDRFNGTTTRISMAPGQANGDSAVGAISADGRYVLYSSEATNLVKGDTNGARDAFLHDNWTFLTQRVSLGHGGQQAAAACSGTGLSADGRFALFNTLAGNLVPGDTNGKSDVFLRDLRKP